MTQWKDISSAPKDGSYIIARIGDGIVVSMKHLYGRCFVIRHEGFTPSGYDMGWALHPGYGGCPDSYFDQWTNIPAPDTMG